MKLFIKVVVLLPVLASVVDGLTFHVPDRSLNFASDYDLDEDNRALRDWFWPPSVSQDPPNEERVQYGNYKFNQYVTALTNNLTEDMKAATRQLKAKGAAPMWNLRSFHHSIRSDTLEDAMELLHAFDKMYNEHKPLICDHGSEQASESAGKNPFEEASELLSVADTKLDRASARGAASDYLAQVRRDLKALVNTKKWTRSREDSCRPLLKSKAVLVEPYSPTNEVEARAQQMEILRKVDPYARMLHDIAGKNYQRLREAEAMVFKLKQKLYYPAKDADNAHCSQEAITDKASRLAREMLELREQLRPFIYLDLAINVILLVALAAIYTLKIGNHVKNAIVNFLNLYNPIDVCKQALQTTKGKISQKIPSSWWPNKDTCRMPTIKSEGKVVLIEYALISILMACTLILAEFDKWAFVLWGLFALFVALQLRFQSSVNPHTAGRDTTKRRSKLPDIAKFFSWAVLRDCSIAFFQGARTKAHNPLSKFGLWASVIAVVFPGVWLLFFVVYISIVYKLVLHHKHEKFGKIVVKADRPGDNEAIDGRSESDTTMTQDQPTTAQQPSEAYPAMNNSTFPQDTTMANASEKIFGGHSKDSATEALTDKEIKKEALLYEQHQQKLEAQDAQQDRAQEENQAPEKVSEDEWEMVDRPE